MAQSDVSFTIHTESTTITAKSAVNSPAQLNTVTRGDTAQFTFRVAGSGLTADSLVVQSSETYTVSANTTEIYTQTDVKENGQLNVEENGTLNVTGGDNRGELEQYADHAGAFSSLTTLNNTQKFREQIPTDADVNSILLGIEPSQTLKDRGINGIWGLVTNGTDERTSALTNNQYTIELQVLAEYADYSDRQALTTDLEI